MKTKSDESDGWAMRRTIEIPASRQKSPLSNLNGENIQAILKQTINDMTFARQNLSPLRRSQPQRLSPLRKT